MEGELHPVADANVVHIGVDDVGQDARTFVELDVGDDVGSHTIPGIRFDSAAIDGKGVDRTRARRGHLLRVGAPAVRTEEPWIPGVLTAVITLRDQQDASRCGRPEVSRLRVLQGWGRWEHGHTASRPRIKVALTARVP